jgi:hypothetical protein
VSECEKESQAGLAKEGLCRERVAERKDSGGVFCEFSRKWEGILGIKMACGEFLCSRR